MWDSVGEQVDVLTKAMSRRDVRGVLVALGSLTQATLALVVHQSTDPVTPTGDDRLLSLERAADRLGMTRKWMYRHGKTLPFAVQVSPRKTMFRERGLEQWLAARGREGR